MNNSSSQTIVSMLVGLVITAFLYGIGPVLLSVFRKKIISKSSLIQFSILYSAAISVLFVIVRYWVDGAVRVNVTPAFLWGTIFYQFAKNRLRRNYLLSNEPPKTESVIQDSSDPEEVIEPKEAQPEPAAIQAEPSSAASETAVSDQPLQKSSTPLKAYAILLTVLFAALSAFSVQQSMDLKSCKEKIRDAEDLVYDLQLNNSALEKTKNALYDEKADAEKEVAILQEQLDLLNSAIGFWDTDYPEYYHHISCALLEKTTHVQVHDTVFLDSIGVKKCPYCWDN